MRANRGYRSKLSDILNINMPIDIRMTTVGPATYDTSCFGVNADGELKDDRYMIFYNQTSSPNNEINYSSNESNDIYNVKLTALPDTINKLVFAVSIDGDSAMNAIQTHKIEILQNGNVILDAELLGKDFNNEKAIVGIEIYKKTEWRISVVARGFDGGLDDLLRSFGGEVESDSTNEQPAMAVGPISEPDPAPVASTPVTAASPVNLEKKPLTEAELTDKMMKKVNLSKDKVNLEKHVESLSKSVVDLSKKSGVDLSNLKAKVVVALDYSGSMRSLYRNGTVQNTINRLVPLGLTFDDNGSIDFYLFQNDDRQMPDVDLTNYDTYVHNVIDRSGYSMGGTNYAPVLNNIIFGDSGPAIAIDLSAITSLFSSKKDKETKKKEEPARTCVLPTDMPTFILFITDGSNSDESATNRVIVDSSNHNVFIQFIGIGNESFSYLRRLDNLSGRARDNTGFTQMSDLNGANDTQLYNEILGEFTNWLKGLQ